MRLESNEQPFDFIHSRCVAGGLGRERWTTYVRDIRNMLRPGGYAQFAEYHFLIQSENGTLTSDRCVYRWSTMYLNLLTEHLNRDPRVGRRLASLMRGAGFRNVWERQYRIPIGPWEQSGKPTKDLLLLLLLANPFFSRGEKPLCACVKHTSPTPSLSC